MCDNDTLSILNTFLYSEVNELVYNDLYDTFSRTNPDAIAMLSTSPFADLLTLFYPIEGGMSVPIGDIVIAAADKQNMEQVNTYLALSEVQEALEYYMGSRVKLMWSYKNSLGESGDGVYLLYALQGCEDGSPMLDGSGIVSARVTSGHFGGLEVSISMNHKAALEWVNLTQANIGRPLAITLGDRVVSVPIVNSRIDK